MRTIVGWVRVENELWEVTMRRMKHRVNQALHQYPVVWWTRRLATYLWKFAVRVKKPPPDCWINQSCGWEPNLIEDAACEYSPYRDVGRPRLKWDDILNRFRICLNLEKLEETRKDHLICISSIHQNLILRKLNW